MYIAKWTYFIVFVQLLTAISGRATEDEYSNDPNVFELTPSTFDKVIHNTNYTSIVKFYAPWCGYCQQFKPVVKKLGKFFNQDSKYDVHVAAVNCDKEYNKQLCAQYQVQSFPTVMIFRPPKYTNGDVVKNKRAASEVYNGERSLKSLVAFANSRIKNYATRFHNVNSDNLKSWFNKDQEDQFKKVLLLTSSNSVSPLLKSLAIDFLNTVKFGMISLKKNDKLPTTFEVDGVAKTLPINEDDKVPVLLYYDEEAEEFKSFNQSEKEKLNDKVKISEWIIQQTKVNPVEGPLSKKEKKYYSNYRTGKKVKKTSVEHDEL
ncbi:thioredoxin-like protein [Scheffersomyces coipomensis]|uniref:thioredoxin-like protein n=1 Tax=Scheffersomyces coipomensis TaxID=1788519 RepID=UPI00315DB1B6